MLLIVKLWLKVCDNAVLLIVKLCWMLSILLVKFKIIRRFGTGICFRHAGHKWKGPVEFGT
jgi:hypothetical protein